MCKNGNFKKKGKIVHSITKDIVSNNILSISRHLKYLRLEILLLKYTNTHCLISVFIKKKLQTIEITVNK